MDGVSIGMGDMGDMGKGALDWEEQMREDEGKLLE